MSKQYFIIANWKMSLNVTESQALARELVQRWAAQAASQPNVTMVLCPSYTALEEVREEIGGTPIKLGAQDVSWEDKGALTGEVSPLTLKEEACEYCIVGHSERRNLMGETDEMVNKKAAALLRHGLNPIICVGETREEREAGQRDAVVVGQVKAALEGLRPVGNQRIIIAYEPVWVIGTGQAVEPTEAASMHRLILETLDQMYPTDLVQQQFNVVYGGSVKSDNLAGFLDIDEIHGGLVGGASLKAPEFVRLAEIAVDHLEQS
jgi:triosephosphate isomerase